MKKHLLYLKYVLRHKWFVLIYCFQMGLYWRGIKHDWTKFLPSEWFPYVNYFYGDSGETIDFDRAWNYHQKRNSHHWQFWLLTLDSGRLNNEGSSVPIPLRMPTKDVQEMVCDWKGAGRALGNSDTFGWYRVNKDNMILNQGTRATVELLLDFNND